MALICSLSNEVPEQPVISLVSHHVFERRVIEKYIAEKGTDPINHEPLSVEQLVDVKVSSLIKPRPPQATSISGILKALQDELDSNMLQTFSLKQQLQTARQELSHALYQHDAACRVIARLTKELAAAREALATLKPQATVAPAAVANPAATPSREPAPETVDVDMTPVTPVQLLQEAVGMSPEVITRLEEKASQLTRERKRRGKTIPEGLAEVDTLRAFRQQASHVGLHSASVPGILTLDVCRNDTRRIVTGGNDKNAVVFNTATEQNVAILRGHTKRVSVAVYHPTEELVFTASPDATVRIWSVEQARCGVMLRVHNDAVTGLDVHATGDYLLSVGQDAHWAFSDLRQGRLLLRMPAMDKARVKIPLTCAKFHPDGLLYGTGTAEGEVKIWDLKEFKNVANFPHCTGASGDVGKAITSLAFSENGYYLASGGADGQVKLWDLRKLKNFKTLALNEERQDYDVRDVVFDQSGSYLAVAGSDVRLFLCKQWEQLNLFNEHTATATGVRFGENATQLITASMDRTVKVYATGGM